MVVLVIVSLDCVLTCYNHRCTINTGGTCHRGVCVCVCLCACVRVCPCVAERACVCVEEGGFVLLQGSVPNLFQNIQSLFMCHTEKIYEIKITFFHKIQSETGVLYFF